MPYDVFGVERSDLAKLALPRRGYYHATASALKRGDVLVPGKARPKGDAERMYHPKGQTWRSSRVWMAGKRKVARSWSGPKVYRVKASPDVVAHRPVKYDQRGSEQMPPFSRVTASDPRRTGEGQFHASSARVAWIQHPVRDTVAAGGAVGGGGYAYHRRHGG